MQRLRLMRKTMMIDEPDKKSSGYTSGFMVGAALGAAAMFFLGTKKGKRLAKQMHQHGGKTVKDLEGIVKHIESKSEAAASHIQKLQEKGRLAAERYFQPDSTKKS